MMIGRVDADGDAKLPIQVRGARQILSVDAVIDTGFSGFLALSPETVEALDLPFVQTAIFTLGNGEDVVFDVHLGTITWLDSDREIPVLASAGGPLIGTAILRGCRLTLDIVDGGDVTVKPTGT